MASIRDVAREAGVASCTVSRVLNGTARVAPETQRKIEDAMKKLDYVPNELARGMFKRRAYTIAMLVPNIQHPWFSSLASEIEKVLYRKGYRLMLFSTSDDPQKEKECFQILKSNIVDGIICGTTACEPKDYLKVGKPMVMLDYKVGNDVPVIVSDHIMGAELAANEFIRSQCSYVIHICNMKQDENIMSYKSHEKLDEILERHGIKTREVPIHWNDFDFDGYFELAKCILEKYPEIDGLMAADLPATAFLKAAIALKKHVPDDFAIVAYDGTFVTKTCTTKMTTVCQPYEKIAHKAVKVLMSLLEQRIDGTHIEKEEAFPVILEKGDTTK